jgi:hypothetical protein
MKKIQTKVAWKLSTVEAPDIVNLTLTFMNIS